METPADHGLSAAEQWLEIELLSPTEARGIWAMFDYVEFKPSRGIRGYGHYHEEYRKENGKWLISTLKLTRLRVDPIVG
ncbi:MAG: nuclear transport factor 2 family protein [Deltaproteobacteria bacterium]|nr:nuclear transport factor 2 family protein [Deltaproteobacteria bacterium]